MNKKEVSILIVMVVILTIGAILSQVCETLFYLEISIGFMLLVLTYVLFNRVRSIFDKLDNDHSNLQSKLNENLEITKDEIFKGYSQTESLINVHKALPNMMNLPHTRGWAASPDALQVIIEQFSRSKPKYILECGSGVSTLVFASLLKKYGIEGKVISLDHDSHYSNITRDKIKENGLEEYVEIIDAPLTNYTLDGVDYKWYDLKYFKENITLKFDFAFVDGPPTFTNKLARYPFYPLLKSYLSDKFTIIIDDAIRPDEQEMGDKWISEDNEISKEYLLCEKGVILLKK